MPSVGWAAYGVVVGSLASILAMLVAGPLPVLQQSSDVVGNPALCTPDGITNESMYQEMPERSPPHMVQQTGTVPSINISINSKGLRDAPFNRSPPDDTVRILVIGDSFTYGYGLNRSERFTDIVESRLQAHSARPVQVINAGLLGGGMRDYYQYLYNRGRFYAPDIVVVAFYAYDSISKQRSDQWQDAVVQEHNISHNQWYTHTPALEAYRNRQERFLERLTWNTSEIRVYGNRMQTLAEQSGFELLLFHILPPRDEWGNYRFARLSPHTNRTVIDRWSTVCDMAMVQAPSQLQDMERYTFPRDGHYNVAANRILADTLYGALHERILEN